MKALHHTQIHTHTHTYPLTWVNLDRGHTHTHTYPHTHTLTHIHTHTLTLTHTHLHTYLPSHTHTYTHTHTHTYPLTWVNLDRAPVVEHSRRSSGGSMQPRGLQLRSPGFNLLLRGRFILRSETWTVDEINQGTSRLAHHTHRPAPSPLFTPMTLRHRQLHNSVAGNRLEQDAASI